MKDKSTLGKLGEDICCSFLTKKGYKILARNYQRRPIGEIDIVAAAADGTLVFVEVKALKSDDPENSLSPEDNLSQAKLVKFKKICEVFVSHNNHLVDESRGWRIDLVAITLPKDRAEELTIENENVVISHYENIA